MSEESKPDVISTLLHDVINSCNIFEKGCEEIVTTKLHSSIEGLLKYVSQSSICVQLFDQEDRLFSDCLVSLLAILNHCRSDTADVILTFFKQIASDASSCQLLKDLGAIDALMSLLDSSSHSVPTITVIARITRHVTLTGHELYVESLLHLLINNILSNDVALKPSLAILVNIANKNLPIQMQLRSLDRGSALRRAIRRLVSHDDSEISVTALAAMTSTGMSEEMNRIVSSKRNLDQLLKLSFSIILAVRKHESFGYAVDVLVNLIKDRQVQHFLLENETQLESFMSKVVCLITGCKSPQTSKLFELLVALASVPGIRIILTKLMFVPVRLTEDSEEEELLCHVIRLAKTHVRDDLMTSTLAIQFLTFFYEALGLDPSLAGSTCHLNFEYLTECLKQNELDNKRHDVRLASCEKILSGLQLLDVLCSSETFASVVLSEVEASTITDIVEYQLKCNPVCVNWNSKTAMQENLNRVEKYSVLGVEIVLKSISILMDITDINSSYSSCLHDYLQRTSLLPFLAFGLTSSLSGHVQLTLRILMKAGPQNMLPVTVLSDVIVGANQRNSSVVRQRSGNMSKSQDQVITPIRCNIQHDDKENIILGSPAVSPRGNKPLIPSSQSSEVDISEKIAGLQVGGDSHISDIISIYEQKLKAQKTREVHLDDLVQAKTLALSQADRLIQQYKSRLTQTDAETNKLRSVVHESEKRSEGYREKMNEMLLDRERIQSEMERLLQESRKLEETQRALASVKRELDTLSEIHSSLSNFTENLKQQHRELESECSLLKASERKKEILISELQSKLSDLQKQKCRLDEQCRKLSQERTNLQEQISSLTTENKKLDKTLKQKEEKLRVISETLK